MNCKNEWEAHPLSSGEGNQADAESFQGETNAEFEAALNPDATASKELHLEQPWRDEALRAALPWPDESANKYTRGKLVIMAGSSRYPGAACLATRAAQRTGVGYAQVVTASAEVKQLVLGWCPSAVIVPADEFDFESLGEVRKGHPQAVCVGPGFVAGSKKADELLLQVVKEAACPVLVDGGGLAALCTKKGKKALAKRQENGFVTVMTPHFGEAARLAEAFDVPMRPPAYLAAELSQATGAVVVLKGPNTYIAEGAHVWPMLEGTAALAKAGTGDVLAGMISALMAQGVEPVSAAILGATLHARAGVEAAAVHTAISVLPEDVVDSISVAIRALA